MPTAVQNSPDCPDKSYLTAAAFWDTFDLLSLAYTVKAQHWQFTKRKPLFSFISLLYICFGEKPHIQAINIHPNIHSLM